MLIEEGIIPLSWNNILNLLLLEGSGYPNDQASRHDDKALLHLAMPLAPEGPEAFAQKDTLEASNCCLSLSVA